MQLGESSPGYSKALKRKDEDLLWVLDKTRMENWSNQELYDLEISFREWLFKCIDTHPAWKSTGTKGVPKWDHGSRLTGRYVREHFNISYKDSKMNSMLTRLCKHYALKVKHNGHIVVNGEKRGKVGYYFPRSKDKVALPYSLRLRFELLEEEGKVVTIKSLPLLRERSLEELNQARINRNASVRKSQKKRWEREKREQEN